VHVSTRQTQFLATHSYNSHSKKRFSKQEKSIRRTWVRCTQPYSRIIKRFWLDPTCNGNECVLCNERYNKPRKQNYQRQGSFDHKSHRSCTSSEETIAGEWVSGYLKSAREHKATPFLYYFMSDSRNNRKTN